MQSSEADAIFVDRVYRRLRGRPAQVLREDFCGTFANLCAWVKKGPHNKGIGIDLDPEPIKYGQKHYLSKLKPEPQSRIQLINGNVLKVRPPPADIAVAMNFSYCIFKERALLRNYFQKVHRGLRAKGIFVTDLFGGPSCQTPITDRTRLRGFTYYWEQATFEPATHHARFHIHFKRDGERLRKRVFSYDWRLWTLPEVTEIMKEAGFKETRIYWEDDKSVFRPTKKGDSDCEAWIAYVVGLK